MKVRKARAGKIPPSFATPGHELGDGSVRRLSQEAPHGPVGSPRRHVEGEAAAAVGEVEARPGAVQRRQRVQEAGAGRVVCGEAAGARVGPVGVGAALQQQLGHPRAAQHRHLRGGSEGDTASAGPYGGLRGPLGYVFPRAPRRAFRLNPCCTEVRKKKDARGRRRTGISGEMLHRHFVGESSASPGSMSCV